MYEMYFGDGGENGIVPMAAIAEMTRTVSDFTKVFILSIITALSFVDSNDNYYITFKFNFKDKAGSALGVIEINGLTKSYGEGKGVFELSLEVEKGEVFGFLGPNGAGKTTTIRMLMGFISPDGGKCSINGLDCRRQSAEVQKSLGYLPGEISFMDEMTGTQFIKFMAGMRGMKSFKKTIELLEAFELDPKGRIKKMSKGTKQKLGIVCAFMHDPEVLLLDEPTSGLDPLMQNRFVELILSEKERGKTIFMSSHIFEEIEKTCGSIGIIKNGRLCAVEDVEKIKASRTKYYNVIFETEDAAKLFSKEPVEVISVNKNIVAVAVSGDMTPFIWAMSKYKISSIESVQAGLEDVFMSYYGSDKGGKPLRTL
jgi:ABC-2 type transport system ATP-binding protein